MKADIAIVAALDRLDGYASNGDIPWRLPEDLKNFRRLTLGGTVAYGKATLKTLPDWRLQGRRNILLSATLAEQQRKEGDARYVNLWVEPRPFAVPAQRRMEVAGDVREALEMHRETGATGPLFVIGGTRAWEEASQIKSCSVIAFITRIMVDMKCDQHADFSLPNLVHEGPIQFEPIPSRLEIWTN